MASLRVVSLLAVCVLASSETRAQCPDQPFDAFEAQSYRIREIRVRGPLVRGSLVRDRIVASTAAKPGAPVTAQAIEGGKQAIRTLMHEIPSLFDSPVTVTVVVADVEACDVASRQLDVSYRLFTTKVPLVLSRTPEARLAEETDPAARLALSGAPAVFRIAPVMRRTATEGLLAGARVSLALPRVFSRLDADVQASKSAAYANIAVAGGWERETGFLRVLDWRLGYRHADRPTDQRTLEERAFAAQVTGLTRSLGAVGGILRFASLFEAGVQRTELSSSEVPPGFIADAGFSNWKNAVGVSLRSRRHAVSASYGLQLGQSRGADLFDYVKHVADGAWDARLVSSGGVWAHRPLDLIGRLSAGRVSGSEAIPVTERFFGGNVEIPFLASDAWRMSATPLLRSFPAYSFNAPGAGAAVGGDGFWSLTVTASIPLWFRPLVPAEVAEDPEIRQGITGQLGSAESVLETSYKTGDPAHREIFASIESLAAAVTALQKRVADLLVRVPAQTKDVAERCAERVDVLAAQLGNVTPATYLEWLVASAESEDEASIPSVLAVCIDRLNRELRDPDLAALGKRLSAAREFIQQRIARIDVARARAQAARDMVFPRQVVDTIFDELNAVSLGPAFFFDAAHLGQREPVRVGVTRYALGVGARLTVASAFHVTAGYGWNPDRHPGEPPGAGFVVVGFSTLFGH